MDNRNSNLQEALGQDPTNLSSEALEAIDREMALQAQLLMENPAFRKAVDDIKRAILTAWAGTKPLATAEREEYQRRYVSLETIEGILRDYLATGMMHSVRIAEEQKRRSMTDRLRKFWEFGHEQQPDGVV